MPSENEFIWPVLAELDITPLSVDQTRRVAAMARKVLEAESSREALRVLGLAGDRKRHRGVRNRHADQKRKSLAEQVRQYQSESHCKLAAAYVQIALRTGASVSSVKRAFWEVHVHPKRNTPVALDGAANLLDCWR